MKPVLQAQAAECGLACLAMVASHHGHRTDLMELRGRFGLSARGASLVQLADIAGQLGLQPRPLRLEPGDLVKLALPCVLHWDLNHFVVLAGWRGARARILDPAAGECWLEPAALSRHFTGVALELLPGGDFRPKAPPPAVGLRQLIGPVRGWRQGLLLLLALSAVLQVFALAAPFLLEGIVDQVLPAADADLLSTLAVGFGGLLVLQVATAALRGWTLLHLSARLSMQWIGGVFAHLLRLPLAWFERRQLGDVVSRLGSVQAIQRTLATSAVEAVIDGAMALATLAMMLAYAPPLALVSVIAVVLYLSLRLGLQGTQRAAAEAQLVAAARQQGHLLESLRGIASLKATGTLGARSVGYRQRLADQVAADLRLGAFGVGLSTGAQLLFGAERLVVLWLGAGRVLDTALTLGMLMAYLAYKDQFATRTLGLVDRVMEFRLLRVHGERLADVVLAAPEPEAARRGMPPRGALRVERLGFRHAESDPWALRECSLQVAPGECLAITGPSGCGKTTLLKLLSGLLAPSEGRITLGGEELPPAGLLAWPDAVGTVLQDDHLFAGTLADNIAFGDPEPDLARVGESASLASLDHDIRRFPMGYQTLVGDMGTSLSGGQRQRLLLARALYRQPRFLLLDEATSHLDLEAERQVNTAVRALRMTRILVAHRPETLASADRVLVMEAGRIVAEYRPARAAADEARISETSEATA